MNATKIDREQIEHGAPTEKQYLQERVRTLKAERDRARATIKNYLKPYPGFTFQLCECGFNIVTLPTGKHYCPKCNST